MAENLPFENIAFEIKDNNIIAASFWCDYPYRVSRKSPRPSHLDALDFLEGSQFPVS
jgi:hypothetical protein